MRISAATALVATFGLTSASPANWLSSSSTGVTTTTNDALKVPGDNPLEFCDADRSGDTITIDNVDLSPNPPQAGTELLIKASGTVLETIEDGAYVKLVVKYGLIRLISTTADFCEQLGNVDLKCPLEKGPLTVLKSVEIPKEVPPVSRTFVFLSPLVSRVCLLRAVAVDISWWMGPFWGYCFRLNYLELGTDVNTPLQGTYHVNAEVFNANDEPITCLTATVKFGGRAAGVEESVEL